MLLKNLLWPKDQTEGKNLRHIINVHIVDRWSYYGDIVTLPYKRQVGVKGESVEYEEVEELHKFLKYDKRALSLWTDMEELHAISNLYQFNIKVITINNHNSTNPRINIIVPDVVCFSFNIISTSYTVVCRFLKSCIKKH